MSAGLPVDDAGALATALASVLDDEALAARLRAAGHAVSARFTWAASAAEHQAIYASAQSLSSRAAPFGINQ